MANWELSQLLLGDDNVSNPFSFLENTLRDGLAEFEKQVRWHYRECAALVKLLENPPEDVVLEMNLRFRLQEHASYLSFLAGRNVLENNLEE